MAADGRFKAILHLHVFKERVLVHVLIERDGVLAVAPRRAQRQVRQLARAADILLRPHGVNAEPRHDVNHAHLIRQAADAALNPEQPLEHRRTPALLELKDEMIRVHARGRFALRQPAPNTLVYAAQHVVALLLAEHARDHLVIVQITGDHVAALGAVGFHQESGKVAAARQRVAVRRMAQVFVVAPVNRQHDEDERRAHQRNHAQQGADARKHAVHPPVERVGAHHHDQIPRIVCAVIFNRAAAEAQLSRTQHAPLARLLPGENLPERLRVLTAGLRKIRHPVQQVARLREARA